MGTAVKTRFVPRAAATIAAASVVTFGVAGAAYAYGYVISSGHVDVVEIESDGTEFELVVHDHDTYGTELDPADTLISVGAGAWTTVGGLRVAILPEDENDADLVGVPWAGFGGEELDPGDFPDGIELTLVDVDGPGAVTFTGATLPGFAFDSTATPDTVVIDEADIPFHEHGQWTFTASGDYTLTFQVTDPSLAVPDSDEVDFHFTIAADPQA